MSYASIEESMSAASIWSGVWPCCLRLVPLMYSDWLPVAKAVPTSMRAACKLIVPQHGIRRLPRLPVVGTGARCVQLVKLRLDSRVSTEMAAK